MAADGCDWFMPALGESRVAYRDDGPFYAFELHGGVDADSLWVRLRPQPRVCIYYDQARVTIAAPASWKARAVSQCHALYSAISGRRHGDRHMKLFYAPKAPGPGVLGDPQGQYLRMSTASRRPDACSWYEGRTHVQSSGQCNRYVPRSWPGVPQPQPGLVPLYDTIHVEHRSWSGSGRYLGGRDFYKLRIHHGSGREGPALTAELDIDAWRRGQLSFTVPIIGTAFWVLLRKPREATGPAAAAASDATPTSWSPPTASSASSISSYATAPEVASGEQQVVMGPQLRRLALGSQLVVTTELSLSLEDEAGRLAAQRHRPWLYKRDRHRPPPKAVRYVKKRQVLADFLERAVDHPLAWKPEPRDADADGQVKRDLAQLCERDRQREEQGHAVPISEAIATPAA